MWLLNYRVLLICVTILAILACNLYMYAYKLMAISLYVTNI
jgi:hypothetical protein